MSDFRKLAHLQEQIGEERFHALISSNNTGKVKEFCDELLNSEFIGDNDLPTEITIGGRTYDVLGIVRGKDRDVSGYEMVERAKRMGANLDQDDGQRFLDNKQNIPIAFCRVASFIFTAWRHPDDSELVCSISCGDDGWVQHWDSLEDAYDESDLVLRPK